MVFAINSACSLLSAKSWTPLCVVSKSTMISGWFSGQPVAKAVTKSADVDRFVIAYQLPLNSEACSSRTRIHPRIESRHILFSKTPLCRRHVGGDFDFDLGTCVDQTGDIEQRRGWKISTQRLFPGCADTSARGLVFGAAG